MKIYKIEIVDSRELKDSEPEVGLFVMLDNKPQPYSRPVNLARAQREGVDDAGEVFHKDVLDYYIKKASRYEQQRYKEAKEENLGSEFLYYPRGRVVYNYNEDKYQIYIPPSMASNTPAVNKIIHEFHLPAGKWKVYGDSFYEPYELDNEPIKPQEL